MVPIDWAFVVSLLGVASIYEHFYFWPRFRADVAAERPAARTRAYRRGVLGQWLLTIAALAIWTSQARLWVALRLIMPHGWRLRSEEHTSELQSHHDLVCRLL